MVVIFWMETELQLEQQTKLNYGMMDRMTNWMDGWMDGWMDR